MHIFEKLFNLLFCPLILMYSPKGGAVNGQVIGSPQNALYMPQGGGYQPQMQQIGGSGGNRNAMSSMYGQQNNQEGPNAGQENLQQGMEEAKKLYQKELDEGKTQMDFDGWFNYNYGG